MKKKGSKGPKRPQKAPFSRALFGFFICVGPFVIHKRGPTISDKEMLKYSIES